MTKRNPLEKQRDILALFIIDEDAVAEFRRRLAYRNLNEEDAKKLFEEYLPKFRRTDEEYLSHSDNYVRDRAGLGSDENKQYIQFFLSKGILVRNEDGELEITGAGIAYLDELNNDLQRCSVRSLNELAEFSLRRKASP